MCTAVSSLCRADKTKPAARAGWRAGEVGTQACRRCQAQSGALNPPMSTAQVAQWGAFAVTFVFGPDREEVVHGDSKLLCLNNGAVAALVDSAKLLFYAKKKINRFRRELAHACGRARRQAKQQECGWCAWDSSLSLGEPTPHPSEALTRGRKKMHPLAGRATNVRGQACISSASPGA